MSTILTEQETQTQEYLVVNDRVRTLVDLHTHPAGGYDFAWNIPFFRGRAYYPQMNDVPKVLLEHCYKKGEEARVDNTLVGIVNFFDSRWQWLFDKFRGFLGYTIQDFGNYISLADAGKTAHFISGQEIPTECGHFLCLGMDRNIAERKLERVLDSAAELGALRVADHSLAELGFLGRVANRFMNGNPRLGMREEELARYKDSIDLMEVGNGNFDDGLCEREAEVARRLGIPGIYTSDAHSMGDVLSSGMFMGIDFSSFERLKETAIASAKNRFSVKYRRYLGRAEGVRHGLEVVKGTFLLKTRIAGRKQDAN